MTMMTSRSSTTTRRWNSQCTCTVWIALLLIQLSGTVQSVYHDHNDLFPNNDEYDFTILDPESVFGSPFGGFSRATRSRLAALPLRLPSIVGEENPNPFHMEISDASGRPFVCRVYHEDEIHPTSLSNSMFDPPREISIDDNTDEKVKRRELDSSSETNNKLLDDEDDVSSDTSSSAANNKKPKDVISGIMEVEKRLAQLTDVCAQLHKGWWSYEWCYTQKVIQFHIHVEESELTGTTFRLTDITKLGEASNRVITMMSGKPENQVAKNSLAQGVKEIARVHDIYKDGEICPETNMPRVTDVMLVCCSHRILDLHKSGVLKKGRPLSSNIASFVSLEEDPEQVCFYNITICTPLLCEQGGGRSESNDADETTLAAAKGRRVKSNHEQESIRDIIESNLDNVCLQSSFGGWWMYELCHGRHIRQFHETIVLDARTGRSQRTAEAVHKLGFYSADDLEDFPDEEEWKYVVNRTDEHIGFGSDSEGMSHGGNGAYFVQEYQGGDVCDHKDVTGAAIKAGTVGEGLVARSASVHYSCGPRVEIVQVNEDSTCHYVVEVTLPELCDHPLFRAAVSKKRIVKCLPAVT